MSDEIDAWLPQLVTHEDRKRLASAVAGFARGLLRAHGDVVTAGAALELVLERVAPDQASTMVALASLRDATGDTASAIALTRRALELEPDRHAALTNLALFLARDSTTLDEAERAAARAVALRPWRRDGWLRLAEVRTARGDLEGAEDARAHGQTL
jgi:predicted Zn-dependent protease